MVVGKRRLLTDGLNRAASKKQIPSVTNSLMSVYSEANGTPNHALQRTAPAVTLAAPPPSPAQPSRQPPPSLSLGSLAFNT